MNDTELLDIIRRSRERSAERLDSDPQANQILDALSDTEFETPSTIAKRAKVKTSDVHRLIPDMLALAYLDHSGNGAWTRYRRRQIHL